MDQNLFGKTAVVTGAALGIGKETSLLLARKGAFVIVSDINETEGNNVVSEIQKEGGKAVFIKCDVTQEGEIVSLLDFAKSEGRRLDIMVNNAGIANKPVFMHKVSTEIWNQLILMDLTSVFGVRSMPPSICLPTERAVPSSMLHPLRDLVRLRLSALIVSPKRE